MASSMAAAADVGGDVLAAYSGICTTRTACISSGDPPAPALGALPASERDGFRSMPLLPAVVHPGECLTCAPRTTHVRFGKYVM